MKSYIVYSGAGFELGIIKAGSHNSAEKKARKVYGGFYGILSVVYTEI